jgi:hypothetical protein
MLLLIKSKGGEVHHPTFEETYSHLNPVGPRKSKPERAQFLRDQDLAGKSYNIITGTLVEYMPSNVPERINKTHAHPSQTSLHGPRSFQGAIRPDGTFFR